MEKAGDPGSEYPGRPHTFGNINSTEICSIRDSWFLKGKCAIKIFDKHLKLKKRYWGRHFWAKGYCVSTVGLNEEEIRKYVRWQLEKDKRIDQLKLWQ